VRVSRSVGVGVHCRRRSRGIVCALCTIHHALLHTTPLSTRISTSYFYTHRFIRIPSYAPPHAQADHLADHEGAERSFREALRLDPAHADAHVQFAVFLGTSYFHPTPPIIIFWRALLSHYITRTIYICWRALLSHYICLSLRHHCMHTD
jgi:hypothetical protein